MQSMVIVIYIGTVTILKMGICIHLLDLPSPHSNIKSHSHTSQLNISDDISKITARDLRRYHLVNNHESDDDRDGLKSKIAQLVDQALHDTETKMKSIQHIKDRHRERAPYRIGFILSLVKKSKDVLSELFNVAVRHKEDWKTLEQLKVFELIVHTNVDTTNLVRQLVDIHLQYQNTSHVDKN